MRKWARNTGRAALVAAGAVAVGAAFGPAGAAADTMTTSGNFSVLGGNQVHAPISIPVEASGNAVGAVLGAAQAQSVGGSSVENARHGGGADMQTSGNFSIGGGNQVNAPISIPVDVCGNAIAIVGIAKAQCKGGAEVSSGGSDHGYDAPGYRTNSGWGHHHNGGMQTSGNFSILGGNQVYAPISVPVNVCGNAVGAVVGVAQAQCKGGASVGDPDDELPPTLRTVQSTVQKESKIRKTSGKLSSVGKKLTSKLRGSGSRTAPAAPNHRTADGVPVVEELLGTLQKTVSGAGVNVEPGQVGPKLPAGEQAPVNVATPLNN